MDAQHAQDLALQYMAVVISYIERIPGSGIVLRYIKSSYQNDPIRSAIELILFLFAVRYLLAPSYSTKKPIKEHLTEEVRARCSRLEIEQFAYTEQEIDDLVEDWTPEPIVTPLTEFEQTELERRPVIVGQTGPKVKLTSGKIVTNLASQNHFNHVASDALKESAISVLRSYGVGPCGPPGFYGTQDVHMRTEADISAHIGVPAAIMYAQAFSTISSVIPCFSKRGDIIVADRAVNYQIRKGMQIARSAVYWYEHNDMADLERVLQKVVRSQKGRKLTRRFIVTEALSENVGDTLDLPAVVALKHKYKFRIILDESLSYGVLGSRGAGLTDASGVDPNEIDMIVGSLAGPLIGGGGFCAGAADVVEHQRITSAAYTFSAALPAILAVTASHTIAISQCEEGERLRATLLENVRALREQLDPRSNFVRCSSAPENPIQLLVLKDDVVKQKGLTRDDEEQIMVEVVDDCLSRGVFVARLRSFPPELGSSQREENDRWQPKPAIKVFLTTGLSKKEIERAGVEIRHAVTKIMQKRK